MIINEIKKNALALMFTNYEHDLSNVDIDDETNDEYTRYTVNMNACINRALARIQNADVLPYKRSEVTIDTPHTSGGNLVRYNLSDIASDIYDIKRIASEDKYSYEPNVDFFTEAQILVISPLAKNEKYIVIYVPKIERISLTATSDTEIHIPDAVAEIIPYFIKAELFEEDEPELAIHARNIFEATLDSLKQQEKSVQTCVKNVFRGWM